jgi:hypothetical protein
MLKGCQVAIHLRKNALEKQFKTNGNPVIDCWLVVGNQGDDYAVGKERGSLP